MRKIPTLFVRNPAKPSELTAEWHPACLWVRDGEGIATRKYDGTCLSVDVAGDWWARREVKANRRVPDRFAVIGHDTVTGKLIGWEPIEQSSFYKWFLEAVPLEYQMPPGTYELIGPKINGDPERADRHRLVSHRAAAILNDAPRDRTSLAAYLALHDIEGIVWHHADGRMAKIKGRDFGIPRGLG